MQTGKIKITGSFHGRTVTAPCTTDGWTADGATRVIITGEPDGVLCSDPDCRCPDYVAFGTRGEFIADSGAKATHAVIIDSVA